MWARMYRGILLSDLLIRSQFQDHEKEIELLQKKGMNLQTTFRIHTNA